MSDAIIVRPALPSDASRLSVLGMQVWLDNYAIYGISEVVVQMVQQTFDPQRIAEQLTDPAMIYLVAEQGDYLLGFSLSVLGNSEAVFGVQRQAEIDKLYVQEHFTRNGIGGLLLAATETALRQREIELYWLKTWIGNQRGLRFYAKQGLQDYGPTYFELGLQKIENRILGKSISQP